MVAMVIACKILLQLFGEEAVAVRLPVLEGNILASPMWAQIFHVRRKYPYYTRKYALYRHFYQAQISTIGWGAHLPAKAYR